MTAFSPLFLSTVSLDRDAQAGFSLRMRLPHIPFSFLPRLMNWRKSDPFSPLRCRARQPSVSFAPPFPSFPLQARAKERFFPTPFSSRRELFPAGQVLLRPCLPFFFPGTGESTREPSFLPPSLLGAQRRTSYAPIQKVFPLFSPFLVWLVFLAPLVGSVLQRVSFFSSTIRRMHACRSFPPPLPSSHQGDRFFFLSFFSQTHDLEAAPRFHSFFPILSGASRRPSGCFSFLPPTGGTIHKERFPASPPPCSRACGRELIFLRRQPDLYLSSSFLFFFSLPWLKRAKRQVGLLFSFFMWRRS